MKLECLAPCHFDMLFEFERDNKAWFEQYVPARPASYSQNSSFVTAQHALLEEQCCETSLFLVLIDENRIAARVNFTDIEEGECEMGYRVGQAYINGGIATQAVHDSLLLARQKLDLYLVYAQAATNNPASIRVLEKSGFSRTKQRPELIRLNEDVLKLAHFELSLQ